MSAFLRFSPALLLIPSLLGAQTPRHPLDPITWEEHWAVLETLREGGRLTPATRFARLALEEPDKVAVWAWQKGQPFSRRAEVVLRDGPKAFEAVVDLTQRRVVSWQERPGAQVAFSMEDLGGAGEMVKSDSAWNRAMRRRGYTDMSFVDCFGIPPGNMGEREFQGRRIAKVMCQDARRYRNLWSRGIEGLYAFVDLNEGKVLRVVDGPEAPLPPPQEYDALAIPPRAPLPPIMVSQPMGAGFTLDGNEVSWQNWSFHMRVDPRVGVQVSTVRWTDASGTRPVLYTGSLSEIFVPYMDPELPWYSNNFLDAGEFAVLRGALASSLEAGIDCPAHAAFFDQQTTGSNGRPGVLPRAACLFERTPGDAAWRHREESVEGRARRDLVLRFTAVLGNYDYVFDWIFQQDGTIRVAVGSTGIAETKTVTATNALAVASGGSNGVPAAARPDTYGRFVAPNIVAVNHDHYFSWRLDLDVGSSTNTVEVGQLKQVMLPKDHPRRSLWVMEPSTVRTETEGKLHMDMARPALWRVTNPSQTNAQGYPVSYELHPEMNVMTLLSEDDWPRRRAGFINHHLWVTPYAAAERYAAGDYPTLSGAGEGLPKYTAGNRRVENTDIVVWYTMGFHHVVRAEDWPVMPVMWRGFDLRPFDFFNRNPALDLPTRP